jgi:hypothetical protein
MATAATKRSTGKVAQVCKLILKCLVQDFEGQKLGADDLEKGYVGLAMAKVKEQCLVNGTITTVDFDLATDELEESGLIGTGPTEIYDNPPGSAVVIFATYSKKEYAFLTKEGYKAAR